MINKPSVVRRDKDFTEVLGKALAMNLTDLDSMFTSAVTLWEFILTFFISAFSSGSGDNSVHMIGLLEL